MKDFKFQSSSNIHSNNIDATVYTASATGDNYLVSWTDLLGRGKSLTYPKSVVERYVDVGWWVVIKE